MKLTKAERERRQALKALQPPAVKEPKPEKTKVDVASPRARQPLAPVPIEPWYKCYDESWRGQITPESFAHPAKAGRALLGKIYDRLFEIGALKTGSVVVDPFGGIGTTGIIGAYKKCVVICHELEPKFVGLANANIEMHRANWDALKCPVPTIIQGDSRKLRHNIQSAAAIVSSPPYSAIASGAGGLNTQPAKDASQQTGRTLGASQDTDQRYGDSDGQLAKLPEGGIDAVISSPPYAESIGTGSKDGQHTGMTHRVTQGGDFGQSLKHMSGEAYGNEPGQLGALVEGNIDAIITSPPYADQPLKPDESSRPETKIERLIAEGQYEAAERVRQHCSGPSSNLRQQDYGQTAGQLGALQAGEIDAVISSPPYVAPPGHDTGHPRLDAVEDARRAAEGSARRSGYGEANGNIAHFSEGEVDAVISSPPYAETLLNDDQRQAGKGEKLRWGTNEEYGTSPGQLGVLKEETGVDAVISSPPYENSINTDNKGGIDWTKTFDGKDHRGDGVGSNGAREETYGKEPGQLGAMPSNGVDAVISSPPFGAGDSASAQSMTTRTDKSAQWVKANCGSAATEGYGDDPGQLAQMPMDDSVDAVLTSPPYTSNGLGSSPLSEGPNGRPNDNKGASQPLDQYGTTPGQLNHASEETFWTAARDIVQECHAILKPGGYAVWIVKAFVRDKQIVDFPGDWRRLCEYVGFETLVEVHAMLVKQTEFTDVFGEERVEKKERKSFFRRLAESKGSPKIDHEVVWIMRKRA